MKRKSFGIDILGVFMLLAGTVHLLPFLFLLMNSVKSYQEIIMSFLSFPKSLNLDNYKNVFALMNFSVVLKNSIFVSGLTVVTGIILTAMCGYKLQRTSGQFPRVLYYIFSNGMIIPFYVIMIPFMLLLKNLSLLNNLFTLVLCYVGFYAPFGTFVFYGFCKSVPLEMEESAFIDGSGPFTTFFRVILPLLLPATATVAVLFMLWSWNDFVVPFLTITSRELRTVTLNQFKFAGGEQVIEWDKFITSLIISTSPILIFYAFAQKYIQKGLISGAVKG